MPSLPQDETSSGLTLQLAHPPERVWAALTTAEGLGTWFGHRAEIDLRLGGQVSLSWDSGDTATLTIERLEPPRVFGYNTTLVAVSRAPYPKLAAFRERMGWTFPWYSSYGSDFNYDFHATLDDRVEPVLLHFRT
jgi:hypothetical protein